MQGLRLKKASNRLELHISDDSDWQLFDEIGSALQHEFHGAWLNKLDGLDQRFWDLKINNSILTLHLEHYFGIVLFPASESSDKIAANFWLEKAHKFLSFYDLAT